MTLPAEEFLAGGAAWAAGPPPARRWPRPAAQWLGVILAHAAVLALVLYASPQVRQTVGAIIQASLIAPQPVAKPPPSPPPVKPRPKPRLEPPPVLAVAPQPEAAPSFFVPPAPPEPAPAAASAPPAPLPLIPPVFNADYLENPPPPYPTASRRLGEKGRVLLRVFVSADGRAERVEVRTSSGFERLDAAAREAVAAWRFVPARRGDDSVAAWVQVPIVFVM